MTKEELIKERDENALLQGKYAKRKGKYFWMFLIGYLVALIILIIATSLVNANSGQSVKPTYYYVLLYVCLGIAIVSTIILGIYLYNRLQERKYKNKRDKASYLLNGLALKKYEE